VEENHCYVDFYMDLVGFPTVSGPYGPVTFFLRIWAKFLLLWNIIDLIIPIQMRNNFWISVDIKTISKIRIWSRGLFSGRPFFSNPTVQYLSYRSHVPYPHWLAAGNWGKCQALFPKPCDERQTKNEWWQK
jgi:hypothetical protein